MNPSKKFLLSLMKSTLVLIIASKFRPMWVLRTVKFLSENPHIGLLADIYDPNVIRKKVSLRFVPRHVTTKISITNNQTKDFEVDINDHIGWKIFLHGYFDLAHLQISRILGLSSNDIFLDIGANIGSVSIPISLETKCEVIAIEANPICASQFLRNLELNPIRASLKTCAVVDPETLQANSFINIFPTSGNQGASSLFKHWNSSVRESVGIPTPTALLDDLVSKEQQQRIKLIKLDIEGSEIKALNGFSKLSTLNAPLVFEYRIDIHLGSHLSGIEKLPEMLAEDFVLYRVLSTAKSLKLTKFDPFAPSENVIALPKSELSRLLPKFVLI